MQLYPNIPRTALCFRNFPLLAIVQQYFYHCLKATEHADSLASLICLLMTFLTGWLRKTSFVESFSDFKRLYRCDFCGQSRRRKFQKAFNNLSANARHFSSGVNRKDSARWSNNALFFHCFTGVWSQYFFIASRISSESREKNLFSHFWKNTLFSLSSKNSGFSIGNRKKMGVHLFFTLADHVIAQSMATCVVTQHVYLHSFFPSFIDRHAVPEASLIPASSISCVHHSG